MKKDDNNVVTANDVKVMKELVKIFNGKDLLSMLNELHESQDFIDKTADAFDKASKISRAASESELNAPIVKQLGGAVADIKVVALRKQIEYISAIQDLINILNELNWLNLVVDIDDKNIDSQENRDNKQFMQDKCWKILQDIKDWRKRNGRE